MYFIHLKTRLLHHRIFAFVRLLLCLIGVISCTKSIKSTPTSINNATTNPSAGI